MTPDIDIPFLLIPLFFIVAALYASVGHGGASGYLALFAFSGIVSPAITPVVLLLNILVASISFTNYWKSGHFSLRLFVPFAVSSVPAAFLGGLVPLGLTPFRILLGIVLLLAAARLLVVREIRPKGEGPGKHLWLWGTLAGLGLGFLSGTIGIGGGIFLSPLLLFLGWADVRRAAATASAFIVVNSVAGLLGHVTRGTEAIVPALPLVAAVAAGALAGSYTGARRIPPRVLQIVLGCVLILAATKLLSQALA